MAPSARRRLAELCCEGCNPPVRTLSVLARLVSATLMCAAAPAIAFTGGEEPTQVVTHTVFGAAEAVGNT